MVTLKTLNQISTAVNNESRILDAILYGSSKYDFSNVDVDVCVVIQTVWGKMDVDTVRSLKKMKHSLSCSTHFDIDLVPHSVDELSDPCSPLYYPKYNPSLSKGIKLKGNAIKDSDFSLTFNAGSLAKFVILDTRTITRRQILRESKPNEVHVFLSKMSHLFGNYLTYYSCVNKTGYIEDPSDLIGCSIAAQSVLGINCQRFIGYIGDVRKELCNGSLRDEDSLIKILNWYEVFVYYVFYAADFEKCEIVEYLNHYFDE